MSTEQSDANIVEFKGKRYYIGPNHDGLKMDYHGPQYESINGKCVLVKEEEAIVTLNGVVIEPIVEGDNCSVLSSAPKNNDYAESLADIFSKGKIPGSFIVGTEKKETKISPNGSTYNRSNYVGVKITLGNLDSILNQTQ